METDSKTQDPSLEKKRLEFEKYKSKVELFKWLIGSVALVIMTTVIDFGFRDRTTGLLEIQQYDKYVTELIILNKEPGQKRMLAQFFANVTPSEKLKKGWSAYYTEVDKEYKKYIAPILFNDSISKIKVDSIIKNLDTNNIKQKEQLETLQKQIENNQNKINPDIVLPQKSTAALEWETKGFSFLLSKDVDNAIEAFRNSENSITGFHMVYDIQRYLTVNKEKLKDQNSKEWKMIFVKIVKDYSWQMPTDVKAKLTEYSK